MYREAITPLDLAAFALIWAGASFYLQNEIRKLRRRPIAT
jgi:hypothetical protein